MNGIIRTDVWTEQRVSRLKELWASGQSASIIAAELGCFGHCSDGGRSAVCGKIVRLKLASRRMITAPKAGCASHAPRALRPDPLPRRNQSNSIAAKLKIAESEPGLPDNLKGEVPNGAGIKIIDLTDKNCHWPKGDPIEASFEFCGGRALKDLPYCAHHSRIAYQPANARRRQPDNPALNRARINEFF